MCARIGSCWALPQATTLVVTGLTVVFVGAMPPLVLGTDLIVGPAPEQAGSA